MKWQTFCQINDRKLILFLLLVFINYTGNAQWSYTMTVTQTGQCIPFPTHQTIYYNTKSACETARQGDLSYSGSDWSFIGGKCTTTITCSPCTGSDVGNQGSGNGSGQSSSFGIPKSGEVSTSGPLDGKPIFTPHHSQAFEDWATEYKQLLESYGVTSILGNEDKYFKLLYNLWAQRFKPKVQPPPVPPPPPPPVPPPPAKINEDASVVDLTGKKGTVKLLRSDEDIKRENDWLKEKGYILTNSTNIEDIPSGSSNELDGMVAKYGLDMIKFGLCGLATPVAIGGVGGLAVTLFATAVISLGFEEVKALSNCVIEENCQTQSEILVNAIPNVITDVTATGLGKAIGKIAENSKYVQEAVTNAKIEKGVIKGIARLSTVEMKISGKIANTAETIYSFGYEFSAEGQTLNEIHKKWSGQ
ncbi:MAG: hypothetical protein M0Q53_17475 [Prolixibacteraceae bacterium]|nr:hypothetical protein [Prolixibacteraceae bacterium]